MQLLRRIKEFFSASEKKKKELLLAKPFYIQSSLIPEERASINHANFEKYLEYLPEKFHPAAKIAFSSIQYITFEDFKDDLKDTLAQIGVFYNTNLANSSVHCCRVRNKSSEWVSRLSLDYLLSILNDPLRFVDIGYDNGIKSSWEHLNILSLPDNSTLIYLDDGSFSTTQIKDFFIDHVLFPITHETDFLKCIKHKKINVIIGVPYISSSSKIKLTDFIHKYNSQCKKLGLNFNISLFYSKELPPVQEFFIQQRKTHEIENFKLLADIDAAQKHLVFFDWFGMSDFASTPDKFISGLIYPRFNLVPKFPEYSDERLQGKSLFSLYALPEQSHISEKYATPLISSVPKVYKRAYV